MNKLKKLLIMSLAIAAGVGPFVGVGPLPQAQAQDNIVPLCFRGRNIGVPAYLRDRYVANGAYDGTCLVSP